MSGFFGIVRQDGKPVEERLLETIAEQLSLRGPEGTHVWKQANIGGCFSWMRTGPAPQASLQPVIWGDRYYLWGDLRLDGRKELGEHLAGFDSAHEANATSEELLLRAWAKWGAESLERVIGDFSFALWDTKEGSLWCARDFVGPRPFYYARVQSAFCFSNTLEILRLVPEISRELDEAFLGDFLLEGWNVEPTRTVYRDIRRLAAGHLLRLSKGTIEIRRFRTLPIEEPLQLKCADDYLEAYRELLKVAVNDRLPEGKTALYLSGGLDSSSVCAIASQIAGARAQKERLKAFTLSWAPFFDDPEPALAKLTAEHLGISQEILQENELTPFEGAATREGSTPEPNGEIFFARERRHSQKIAAHANVVLAGDGGDDVLTGQGWPYLVHLWRRGEWKEIVRDFGGYFWAHQSLPPIRGGFRTKLRELWKRGDPYEGYPEWLNEEFATRANLRQRWLERDVKNAQTLREHPLHREAYAALHGGFWASVLETEDAGWNRVRLETRAPLLDLRILRFLLRLPPVPWCVNKELCRRVMRDALPTAVTERAKTPLLIDPIEKCGEPAGWMLGLPQAAPGEIERFVNWAKWCETLYRSKGSLRWSVLRPVSLLHWLNAVESRSGIQ
jgi:asparagine synthase (glutamine-hydrolysing)